ncbi:hypothetical protein ABTY98_28675 [Streptomyces sp. NPDC096040]|uniref:hypothetical protein n=1 Tax=Streptomyces sp. NPDC096040 TaxID=3155541 RepID=UPI003319335E
MYEDWFEDDELNSEQKAFVDVVRESARSWPDCRPIDTVALVFEPEEEEEDGRAAAQESQWEPPAEHAAYYAALDEAIARGDEIVTLIVDLVDRPEGGKSSVFMCVGATILGDRVFCSERHTQNWQHPEPTRHVQPLTSAGPPEHLGRIAAAWFEEIMYSSIIVGRGGLRFVPQGTALPPHHRWVRNGPRNDPPDRPCLKPALRP